MFFLLVNRLIQVSYSKLFWVALICFHWINSHGISLCWNHNTKISWEFSALCRATEPHGYLPKVVDFQKEINKKVSILQTEAHLFSFFRAEPLRTGGNSDRYLTDTKGWYQTRFLSLPSEKSFFLCRLPPSLFPLPPNNISLVFLFFSPWLHRLSLKRSY